MAGLNALARQLDTLREKQIPEATNKLTKKVAEQVLLTATGTTRVDTSKAVSNWAVKLGSPPTHTISAYVEGKAGSTGDVSRDFANTVGTNMMKSRKFGQDINVGNNVEYIDKLDAMDSMERQAEQAGNAEVARNNELKGLKL